MIDQRRLPWDLEWLEFNNPHQVAEAIMEMVVRGAPAIGASAAFGLALAAQRSQSKEPESLLADLEEAAEMLRASRPTAVNLAWAVDRLLKAAASA